MRRAIRLAMRLYPRAWRERYGREFEALLEDVRPGWREIWDVVGGALKMQLAGWSWRKTAAAFALAGAAAAGVMALRTPDVYISTAVMRMPASADAPRALNRAQQGVLSRTSLAQIIMTHGLYPEERSRLPLEDIVASMRNRYIRITSLKEGDAFAVSFQYRDRVAAQSVTRDLANRLLEASGKGTGAIEVLDPASLPQRPSEPNRAAWVAIGTASGLILGFLFLGVRRWPLVAASGVAAAVLALAVAYAIPDRWVSTAVLRLDHGADTSELIRATLSDASLQEIVQRPYLHLYEAERSKERLDRVVERMRNRDVRITPLRQQGRDGRDSNAFAISFMADDRLKAQAVVRVLVTRMTEQTLAGMRRQFEKASPGMPNLEVLDPASLPEQPAAPNRLVILLMGLGLGLAGGVVVSRRRTRVKALAAEAV
jgi:uncharacterized protein involved in exopolysaccharide biosynthesis